MRGAFSCIARPSAREEVPLVLWFAGLGAKGGSGLDQVQDLGNYATRPFVLASARRPHGQWRAISDDGAWGWIDGDIMPGEVERLGAWAQHLARQPGIDQLRDGVLGFPAGAYCVTELLARPEVPFFRVAIGGVHGHGQPDMEGVEGKRKNRAEAIVQKWCARLNGRCGARGGIYVCYNREDKQCR